MALAIFPQRLSFSVLMGECNITLLVAATSVPCLPLALKQQEGDVLWFKEVGLGESTLLGCLQRVLCCLPASFSLGVVCATVCKGKMVRREDNTELSMAKPRLQNTLLKTGCAPASAGGKKPFGLSCWHIKKKKKHFGSRSIWGWVEK